MKVYISGPMTGLPGFNYPAFHEASTRLRAMGYEVENPANNAQQDAWIDYMRIAVAQLAGCDAVYLLPGWSESRGAQVEYQLARGLGLWVMYPPRQLGERQRGAEVLA